jgi:benzoyl-CoA reductase/2-hydroxyglutaryl-CoA dehydratase subunit BcrC/BadD/HgdB
MMAADLVKPFEDALDSSPETLAGLARDGCRVFGYFCTYTPIELVDACGWIPVRISGGPGSLEKATSRIPDFICPFMKRSLEKALDGEYRYLSGIIDGYTCDAACGTANIWADTIGGDLFRVLPLPYNDSPEARLFLREVLAELVDDLGKLGAEFSEQALAAAIETRERIGRTISALYELRYERRLPLGAGELWTVIQAGFGLPPGRYQALLADLFEAVKAAEGPLPTGVPILVSGSLIESAAVMETIETSGGTVVADDLCTGLRAFSPPPAGKAAPFDRLMDRHFNRVPCPSRVRAEDRLARIRGLLDRSGARGVLFVVQKFCTPHLADYPFLSTELKKEGIPVLLVEMDENWQTQGQFETRLEAFFEMLNNVCLESSTD